MTNHSSPVSGGPYIADSLRRQAELMDDPEVLLYAAHYIEERLNTNAQCARADIAKAIAYDLENGSAHGARVVTTPHLDNYHVTGHVNLLALADAVLALSATDGGGT